MTGRFVTFEGSEGCGKTTQIRLAAASLAERGIPVFETAEPGGTPLGRRIREILLNRGSCTIGAEAELLLFAAARAQHVREIILPALKEGTLILCDRFADATVAYQGFGRGLDADFIRILNAFSALSLKPDMTLLFDLPVATGLARAQKRAAGGQPETAEDRFEHEDYDFHERIRKGYLTLAAGEPDRFRIIDGAADVETVHREVCRCLAELS
ncbi:MAG: dTMP kinase [Syntrophus sp. (in: bacteria)]|nr:dTMP kinase [Syntrophus sp. (in: bacteria)]